MLEAKLQHAVVLRRMFESITNLVQEVNLECDETGLKLQAMDNSHVALVSFHLTDAGFEHYRCDRRRSLGLNLLHVCKVFKMCNVNDSVKIENEDDSETITFVFENSDEEKVSTFSLRLMELDQEAINLPDGQNFGAVVTFNAKEFASIMSTCKEFSDDVRIDVDKHGVKFITQGDIGGGEVLLKPREGNRDSDQDVGVEVKVKYPVSQSLAAKHMCHFAKASALSSACILTLTKRQPVEVRFDILEPAAPSVRGQQSNQPNSIGYFRFFLAPKMDEEDFGGEDFGSEGEGGGTDLKGEIKGEVAQTQEAMDEEV